MINIILFLFSSPPPLLPPRERFLFFVFCPIQEGDYFVTLILSAKPHRDSNITLLEEYGLDQIVVFQTDTTQPDSSGRLLLAKLSAATLAAVVLVNMVLSVFT